MQSLKILKPDSPEKKTPPVGTGGVLCLIR
jgi:hypothetical protein